MMDDGTVHVMICSSSLYSIRVVFIISYHIIPYIVILCALMVANTWCYILVYHKRRGRL